MAGISRQTSTTGLFELAPVRGRQRKTPARDTSREEPRQAAMTSNSSGGDVRQAGAGDVTGARLIHVAATRLERLSEADVTSGSDSRSLGEDAASPPCQVSEHESHG